MFRLGRRSKERLEGLHPDLILVIKKAITLTTVDFTVLEGMRSEARQRELFVSGASRTMNSRHLTGHAVDLGAWVAGGVRWDWPLYDEIGIAMKRAADMPLKIWMSFSPDQKIKIEWGGDWRSFRDGPHFQLPWADYPA